MALVTVRAVIHISVHALVIAVGVRFVRVLMATETREDQVIRRIRVARVAGRGTAMRLREVGVVEHRSQPARRAVAGLTGGRETRRRVSGIRRPVVVGLVATDARRIRNVVVAVDVALRTSHRCSMETRQRPARRRVIELAVRPQNRVVAGLAGRRETGSNMVHRSLRVVVVRLVARHAGRIGQRVVVVHMALRARCRRVEARQRPACTGVIELSVCPQNGVMAAFTRRREAQRNVINRRLRVVVIGLVA